MSISFYPATIVEDGNFRISNAVIPLEDCPNFANGNAWEVLQTLGIEPDYCGSMSIATFAGLTSAWLRSAIGRQSAEVEATMTGGNGSVTVINCGRPAGYMNRRIHELALMARQGAERGATYICWA